MLHTCSYEADLTHTYTSTHTHTIHKHTHTYMSVYTSVCIYMYMYMYIFICCRSLQIDWMTPGNPNGIILGYDLLRKTWHLCHETQKLTEGHSDELCKAVKCQHPENICGQTCYSPETKVDLFTCTNVNPCPYTVLYYDKCLSCYAMKITERIKYAYQSPTDLLSILAFILFIIFSENMGLLGQ